MGRQERLNEIYKPLIDFTVVKERMSLADGEEKILNEIWGPFLVETTTQYEESELKAVIVGQENNGWMKENYFHFLDSRQPMERALREYREFVAKWEYKSPFFQYFHDLREQIHGSAGLVKKQSVLWSNLFKVNHNGKSTLASTHYEKMLALQSGIFRAEMEILNPEVVIFLTGPRYDQVIEKFYDDAKFIAVEPHLGRQVARVEATGLPMLAFRSYHPSYVNRKSAERKVWYDAIVEQVRRR